MIIQIDPSNSVPIYRQIMEQIIYRIAAGELLPGDQLPSIRRLSTSLRINPNTVIKSYRELELSSLFGTETENGSRSMSAVYRIDDDRLAAVFQEVYQPRSGKPGVDKFGAFQTGELQFADDTRTYALVTEGAVAHTDHDYP